MVQISSMTYLLLLLLGTLRAVTAITLPASYDVVWNTPSQVNGSASSMPVGGGDIGLNAWSENGLFALQVGKVLHTKIV